jgi:TolA-binding protein
MAMKRISILLLLSLAFASQGLYAADKGDNKPGFWDALRSKLESFTPQKKVSATTAVGGVRGAATASDDMYWKGASSPQAIDADELEAFMAAMRLNDAHDEAQAQTAFAEFIKKYPESTLRKDAEQALSVISSASTPAE